MSLWSTFFTHVSHFWGWWGFKNEKIEIFFRGTINALLPNTYVCKSMSKSNHQHIVSRAASYQHLWKFSGELRHQPETLLQSINDFKQLMRQIAKCRDSDDAVVEYVVHLVRQTDGTINLKFLASLPLSKTTGDEYFIHESELDAIVHSLLEGDVLHFAAFDSEPSVSIADRLGFPASGSLSTKFIMSRGIVTERAAAAMDTSCAFCGK